MRFRLAAVVLFIILSGVVYQGRAAWPAGAQGTGHTTQISLTFDGGQPDKESNFPALSGDGRYIAFGTAAGNLVPGDTNDTTDVFVYDRQLDQMARVSLTSTGGQGNGGSTVPALSRDGRYVAFQSFATNLVPGDTKGKTDIFVYDRQADQLTRVSVDSNGMEADSHSYVSALSDDGRYVAFSSDARNLAPGDTNNQRDVFVRDRQMGQTIHVSVASNGTGANNKSNDPAISGDGRYVAFESLATNLVPGAGDTNGENDVFVHDRQTGQTMRVSVSSNGTEALGESIDPVLSDDGRYVAFSSSAANLVSGDTNNRDDVFVHDRQTGQTTRVSVASDGTEANGNSIHPELDDSGRYVAFQSFSGNLVPGDDNGKWDIFLHDREGIPPARLTLIKVLGDDDLVEDFRFEGPTGVFTLTTETAANSRTFDLPAGTHTFRETTSPADFALIGVTCVDAEKNDVTGDVVDFSAIEMRADVTLAPAADLTCTFLNDRAVSTQNRLYLPLIIKMPEQGGGLPALIGE